MSQTKQRILEVSLLLFNQHGVANVSQRRITETLSMSPGNLTYHFRRKEDIIEALYFELVGKMNRAFNTPFSVTTDGIDMMEGYIKTIFTTFYTYRFIFIDLVYLMKTNDKIASHYRTLLQAREEQFHALLKKLIASGLFLEEKITHEHHYLYKRIQLMTDFYFSAAEVSTPKGITEGHMEEYRNMIWHTLCPYLSHESQQRIFV